MTRVSLSFLLATALMPLAMAQTAAPTFVGRSPGGSDLLRLVLR